MPLLRIDYSCRLAVKANRLRQLSDLLITSVEPRMTSPPAFCFVIPCFNEEDNVDPTVGSVRAAMGRRGDYEIVLVNDASTDRTLEQMQALAAADPRIRVLDNPTNLGFGGSYTQIG